MSVLGYLGVLFFLRLHEATHVTVKCLASEWDDNDLTGVVVVGLILPLVSSAS